MKKIKLLLISSFIPITLLANDYLKIKIDKYVYKTPQFYKKIGKISEGYIDVVKINGKYKTKYGYITSKYTEKITEAVFNFETNFGKEKISKFKPLIFNKKKVKNNNNINKKKIKDNSINNEIDIKKNKISKKTKIKNIKLEKNKQSNTKKTLKKQKNIANEKTDKKLKNNNNIKDNIEKKNIEKNNKSFEYQNNDSKINELLLLL